MTAGVIYYQNKGESYTLSREASSATEVQVVPWEDAQDYAETLVGGAVSILGNVGFQMPAKHPFLELYVADVNVRPIGNWNAAADDWEDAEVTITYGMIPLGGGNSDETLREITLTVQSEEIVQPKEGWRIGGQKLKEEDVNPVYVNPVLTLQVTYNYLPLINPSIFSLSGMVNSGIFSVNSQLSFPAQTVMFQNPTITQTNSTSGQIQYRTTFTFVIRPNGWNKAFRAGEGWVSLADSSGNPMYTPTDLNAVWPT